MLNFLNILEIYENKERWKSVHGEHFSDCPWSKDNCSAGPDTCDCIIYNQRKHAVINLIEMYNKYLCV